MGGVLLSLNRQTRRFALIGLPTCIFTFFIAHKWQSYLYPEDFLLIAGELLLLGKIAVGASRFVNLPLREHLAGIAVVLLGLFMSFLWFDRAFVSGRPLSVSRVIEADIARAAALQIVGPDASIAGRIGLWYISGAHRWNTDFAFSDLPAFDPDKLIRSYDYIVDHNFFSEQERSPNDKTFLDSYIGGHFGLAGFINSRSETVRTLFRPMQAQ